jgi:transposase
VLSVDEKPGLQAIGTTAPDRPPVPDSHPAWARDHEYVRHGTMSLLAAIDLLDGHVLGHVVERHTGAAFIDFLRALDARYPADTTIRLVLDKHAIHTSRETTAHLDSRPGRFDLVFTPKHGSWLNLIESFFGKMARTVLRGMRVSSKEELRQRLELYFEVRALMAIDPQPPGSCFKMPTLCRASFDPPGCSLSINSATA